MKYVFTFILSIAMHAVFGQVADTVKSQQAADANIVDKRPVYAGCNSASSNEELLACMNQGIIKLIEENFKFPKDARKAKKQGKILVSYVVEKDGRISNVTIVKGVFPSLDTEAIRVVKLIPRFDAAAINEGKKVRMQYTVPINVSLQ